MKLVRRQRKAPLSPATMRLCRAILLLDRLPRYGRIYTYRTLTHLTEGDAARSWKYQKYGRWGLNLLDDLGLMWAYVDTESADKEFQIE